MKVIFYRENDGTAPYNEWLDYLPTKAQAKYVARPKGLQDLGYDLPRSEADYLGNGMYELRASLGGVHYRILYLFFYLFSGNLATVGSHGITKEQRVSRRQVERAIQGKNKFTTNPTRYTFGAELS